MKEYTKYKVLMMSSEKEVVDIITLEKEMKKLKGYTLTNIERTQEAGVVGYILKLTFLK